jgi:hypothetical protein
MVTAKAIFEPPPVEWIAARLSAIQELLERQTGRSALLLRRILGLVRLKPVRPEVGRPHYQTDTALEALELLEAPEAGSNWSRQWRRGESNRAGEDEEGEEGSIGGTLKMCRLQTSPVPTHHVVPEGRHTGARTLRS